LLDRINTYYLQIIRQFIANRLNLSCKSLITFNHLIRIFNLLPGVVGFLRVANSLNRPIIKQAEGHYSIEHHSKYGNKHINNTSIRAVSKNRHFCHKHSTVNPKDRQIIHSTWLREHAQSFSHILFDWRLHDSKDIYLKIYCFRGCSYNKRYACRPTFRFSFHQFLWGQWDRLSIRPYFNLFVII
jgi:hypothetical protein